MSSCAREPSRAATRPPMIGREIGGAVRRAPQPVLGSSRPTKCACRRRPSPAAAVCPSQHDQEDASILRREIAGRGCRGWFRDSREGARFVGREGVRREVPNLLTHPFFRDGEVGGLEVGDGAALLVDDPHIDGHERGAAAKHRWCLGRGGGLGRQREAAATHPSPDRSRARRRVVASVLFSHFDRVQV
jgi:hypothetical protein